MRVAVVHHWFVTRGGGERVAECIAALFPRAELFTLIASDAGLPQTLKGRRLHCSFLQRIPFGGRLHRHFLPVFPQATKSLDLYGFDLVLSSDSGPVKGIRISPGAVHICYCHSPMRYLWDGYESYRNNMGPLTRTAFSLVAHRVRRWDAEASRRVTAFLSNSRYVAERISRSYGREATVLHPPIDLQSAEGVRNETPQSSYLCAGRLVAYKRTDLIIEACIRLGRELRIAGVGPELKRLKKLAAGNSRIVFLGALSHAQLWCEYARCRALLFAADEDFGMVALEAQACGRPVIAFGAGGSLETVRGGAVSRPTGLLFPEQTVASLADAIVRWESSDEGQFVPEDARRWASLFSTPKFLEGYRDYVLALVPEAAAEMASVEEAYRLLAPGAEPDVQSASAPGACQSARAGALQDVEVGG